MKKITIYTADYCGFCHAAKALLTRKGVPFDDVDVTHDAAARRDVAQRSGQSTVPQIFVGDESIGGFAELQTLEVSGELDDLLAD